MCWYFVAVLDGLERRLAEGTCKVLSDYYSQISNQGFLAFFMGARAN